jgi:hypothetical protein
VTNSQTRMEALVAVLGCRQANRTGYRPGRTYSVCLRDLLVVDPITSSGPAHFWWHGKGTKKTSPTLCLYLLPWNDRDAEPDARRRAPCLHLRVQVDYNVVHLRTSLV